MTFQSHSACSFWHTAMCILPAVQQYWEHLERNLWVEERTNYVPDSSPHAVNDDMEAFFLLNARQVLD